jgi:hypothetical protein
MEKLCLYSNTQQEVFTQILNQEAVLVEKRYLFEVICDIVKE